MKTGVTQNWLVCRICLQQRERMEKIFSENVEKDMTKMILECGGVPIKQFDHYPDKICFQCDRYLKIAYKFRMVCQRSHRHLSKFIAPVVIEETSEDDESKIDQIVGEDEVIEDNFNEYVEDSVGAGNINAESEFRRVNMMHSQAVEETETNPGGLYITEEGIENEDVSLKLEPDDEDETINIKKEMSELDELDEGEIVDFYEPIDVEIFDEFEEEPLERTNSALSEEIEYLDEIMNEDLGNSEEYIPNLKPEETLSAETSSETVIEQQMPKGRGRPKGSKNSKPSSSGGPSTNTIAAKGKQPDRRGRKPKNPDFTVYICDICGNTYPTQGRLTDHIRKHNPVKPHECEICGHAFVQAQQLSRHMNTHTGNRPYKCNYCPAAFADLSTRNKHHRIHTKERPYVCDVCGKAFAYTNTLKFHKMIHTGEKPFACHICGKGFHQAYKLRNHKMTHEKRAIKAKKLQMELLASYQEAKDATSQILEL